ncbi:HAD family hydrolase [Natrarchaeobius halalkaliphilus]|uniref:HAD family hydrolase n=1 Tax=Natrarchaeobius halalkaliphilus TaxID=1679091 RepID=A0A3N6LMM9_9EURY|nr:HAD family hydrolase [Natrarchaeobius halalkaliphilus]RQG86805.1 HAD family hydrolase [Natrarchaeobius halalkaliphilus]
MVETVIFDLDNTLVVFDRDRNARLAATTDEVGAPPLTNEEYLSVHKKYLTNETREPIFAELLADQDDIDPAAAAAAYRDVTAEAILPLDGVVAMLEELSHEYSIGLLTNGPERAQREKLATLGWDNLFDEALATGEIQSGKPDSLSFKTILNELAVSPEEAVYVGDSIESDINGATNAGLRAIQVLYDGGPDPHSRAAGHVEQNQIAEELPSLISTL